MTREDKYRADFEACVRRPKRTIDKWYLKIMMLM